MKFTNKIIIIIISLFVLTNYLNAQPQKSGINQKCFLMNLGLGIGSLGVSGNANVAYQFDKSILSFRGVIGSRSGDDEFWDAGILYGVATAPSLFTVSIAAGIAAVGGSRAEGSVFVTREDVDLTIGLPIEALFSFRPFSHLGIGLYGFANINAEKSFGGINLCFHVGRVR